MPKTSDSIGIKISELGDAGVIKENDVVPINTKTDAGVAFTKATKINDLRQTLGFENAFLSVDAGLDATVSGDVFFVYETAAKLWVLQYQNVSGVANPVLGYDNNQVRLPTARQQRAVAGITESIGYDIVGKVESFSALRKLSPFYDGQHVLLKGWYEGSSGGAGEFIGRIGTREDDYGSVAAGNGFYWERVLGEQVNPEMFGIVPGDKTTVNNDRWTALFNLNIQVSLPIGNWYCNGGEITITNKSFSLVGKGKHQSNLVFTTTGHGIRQTADNYNNGVPKYFITDVSIKTTVLAKNNVKMSGFLYDASGLIATLSVISSGYKYIPERIQSRGTMRNVSIGTFSTESNEGWAQAVELIGVLDVIFDTCTFELPRDFSGDGVWFHGDGMQAGVWFTNCVSMFGKIFFRMNDYLEGLYIQGCNIINNHYGIYSALDSDSTVTSPVKLNTPVIHNTHFFSYIKAIFLNWSVGGRFTDLEIYLQPTASISQSTDGIDIITCDSLILDNINCTYTTDLVSQGTCIQLHTGRNNRISNVSHRGTAATYIILLATTSSLSATTVKSITTTGATYGIYANLANLVNSCVCDVPVVNGSGKVSNPIQTSAEALAKISYNFKRHLIYASHAYTAVGTLITLDISKCGFNGTPLFVFENRRGAAYGGQIYQYRNDASDNTKVVIQVSGVTGYTSDTTSNRTVYFEVVGY